MQAPGGDFERIKTTDSTKYTVTGLKSGVTYKFRVRAIKTVDGKNINGGYKTFSVKVK
ncbi:MAG: fibronectin type III domain-containing protein [Clostridia bacterium]|nr:fibronectin type III domain-containing protein [Clostridia bacterium]